MPISAAAAAEFHLLDPIGRHQKIEVIGTKGRVEIVIPFNAPPDQPTALLIDHGLNMDTSLARREIIPACDQYTEQRKPFALAVLSRKSLPYGVEDASRTCGCSMRF